TTADHSGTIHAAIAASQTTIAPIPTGKAVRSRVSLSNLSRSNVTASGYAMKNSSANPSTTAGTRNRRLNGIPPNPAPDEEAAAPPAGAGLVRELGGGVRGLLAPGLGGW